MELLGQNKIDHHQRQVATLSQDSFYKELTPEQKAKAVKGQFNFDHPGNMDLMPWARISDIFYCFSWISWWCIIFNWIDRCFWQRTDQEDATGYHSGGNCSDSSIWFRYPFQVLWTTLTLKIQSCYHHKIIILTLLLFLCWCFRKDEFVTLYPADVVLFEGILIFYSQEIRDVFQMKLFVDTDADTRLSRRGKTPSLHESKAFLIGHVCVFVTDL